VLHSRVGTWGKNTVLPLENSKRIFTTFTEMNKGYKLGAKPQPPPPPLEKSKLFFITFAEIDKSYTLTGVKDTNSPPPPLGKAERAFKNLCSTWPSQAYT
jgi:hypothetical protein